MKKIFYFLALAASSLSSPLFAMESLPSENQVQNDGEIELSDEEKKIYSDIKGNADRLAHFVDLKPHPQYGEDINEYKIKMIDEFKIKLHSLFALCEKKYPKIIDRIIKDIEKQIKELIDNHKNDFEIKNYSILYAFIGMSESIVQNKELSQLRLESEKVRENLKSKKEEILLSKKLYFFINYPGKYLPPGQETRSWAERILSTGNKDYQQYVLHKILENSIYFLKKINLDLNSTTIAKEEYDGIKIKKNLLLCQNLREMGIYSEESLAIEEEIQQMIDKVDSVKARRNLNEWIKKYEQEHEKIKIIFFKKKNNPNNYTNLFYAWYLRDESTWLKENLFNHIVEKANKIFPLKDLNSISCLNHENNTFASMADFVDEKTYAFELNQMRELGIFSIQSQEILNSLNNYDRDAEQRYVILEPYTFIQWRNKVLPIEENKQTNAIDSKF